MGVLIDTSVLVAIERGHLSAGAVEDEPSISVITVSELLHGVHRATGGYRLRRQAMVSAVLDQFEVVDITEQVARVHAEIWAMLEQDGARVGEHDLWIGATALTHGMGVVTRNAREFARIPGLRVATV